MGFSVGPSPSIDLSLAAFAAGRQLAHRRVEAIFYLTRVGALRAVGTLICSDLAIQYEVMK